MSCLVSTVLRVVPLLALLAMAACAEPPSKEMNQAQGAIETARAAGADRYATEEFSAAVESLTKSDVAVRDRDYRLALNFALDSRERAQNAARLAVDGRALARGNAERILAEVSALITRARERLADVDTARLPATVRAEADANTVRVEKSVQEARTALGRDDYTQVQAALQGQSAVIDAVLKALDASGTAAATRPKR